jgi:hypothetical protein
LISYRKSEEVTPGTRHRYEGEDLVEPEIVPDEEGEAYCGARKSGEGRSQALEWIRRDRMSGHPYE